jgi:hypothetical protein
MRNARTVARNAAVAFIAHGTIAVAVLTFDQRPGGADIYGWDAARILEFAERPVLWVIDGILQNFRLLPLSWFHPNFELWHFVNVLLIYVLVGGIFYAALVAGVSMWFGRHGRRATVRNSPEP